MTNVHFSSARRDYETPPDLFAALDQIFHFTLDVCATHRTAKCGRYYTPEQDGLSRPWRGMVWCNPPYGRGIGRWVRRATEADATVVCLIPARTDTQWWHRYVIPHGRITYLRGRLAFRGSNNWAPFPSAIVVFDGDGKGPKCHIKTCQGCGRVFGALRSDAATCSGACRMRLSRTKKR
jgi:phage N-6-adenine-methyltransferase